MKTSIRYAKENDREKEERKKGRRRDIYVERERTREVKGQRGERDRESERESKILVKPPKPRMKG